MTQMTVPGVYRDGAVILEEEPTDVRPGTSVLVVFPVPVDDPTIPRDRESRHVAGMRLLARLRRGIPFGGPPYPDRSELYQRSEDESPGG